MHPWVGLIIAHAHSYQPSEGPQTPSLYVCGYLLIFVYLSDFSNRHQWPDILSIDPEWFQPFWHRQIIYQSIYTVWRFLFLFFFFNDSLSLLSHEDTYVKLSSLCLSLTLFKSMTQKDTKFSKPLPTLQANTLVDLNDMYIAHQHHLVGLGCH